MKFDFSKSSDLQNKLSIDKLDLILKNILYCTYKLDSIHKNVNALVIDKSLQKQVDEYFEEDSPEDDSSSTDSG